MADDTLPLLYVPGSTVLHVNRHADAGMAGQTLRADCATSTAQSIYSVSGGLSLIALDWLADHGARVCSGCQRSSPVAREYQRRIELRRTAHRARAAAMSPGSPEPAQLLLEV